MLTNCLINIYDIKSKSNRMCCKKREVQSLPVFVPSLAFAGTLHALLLCLRVGDFHVVGVQISSWIKHESEKEREEQ
jgi:hypothetical protein